MFVKNVPMLVVNFVLVPKKHVLNVSQLPQKESKMLNVLLVLITVKNVWKILPNVLNAMINTSLKPPNVLNAQKDVKLVNQLLIVKVNA